jgi:hypothetical protein
VMERGLFADLAVVHAWKGVLPQVAMLPAIAMSPAGLPSHSLVRLRGPFLGADLPPRRASRAGLVQDAACGTGAERLLVLDETEHGATLVQVGPSREPLPTPRLWSRPVQR